MLIVRGYLGGVKNVAHDLEVVGNVPPGTNLPSPDVQGKFRKLATDTLALANKALGKYRELVAFIRDNQLPPAYVRAELIDRGFFKGRASEIIRVADASIPDYEAFQKGDLSFRAVLQFSRENSKPEVREAVQKHRERESEKFRRELNDLLGLYVPLSGGLPKYLTLVLKGEVNGYPWSLKIGRKKKEAE